MSQLNHKGPEDKGAKTGRKLGNCEKTVDDETKKGVFGLGLGKRYHSAKSGTGKSKRKQYHTKKEYSIKIAIPTRNNQVDHHFGHCEYYTIFEIDKKSGIKNKNTIKSPQGCGCKSDIASILQKDGVELMLAGNMGAGALHVLNASDIKVIRGCSGDIDQLISQYLQGNIQDSGLNCKEHESNHQCSH